METFARWPKLLLALASGLSAALIATAAFLGFPQASSSAESHFEAQLALVASLAEREGVGRGLRQAAETPALTNLGKTLPGSLRDTDRRLLELISFLASPRMTRVHQKVASHKDLTSADRRLLRRVIRLLDKNSAIAAIRQRGERLKHDPARLESAWRENFRDGPPADPPSTPGGTPLGAIEAALNKPIPGLNNRPISARGAALLASRAGLRYMRGLPPLALGMVFPSSAQEGEGARSSLSICASGSIGPSVRTMLEFGANQVIGDAVTDVAEQKVGSAVYWDAAFGTRAPAWKLFKRFTLVTTLSDAVDTGEGLADAAWNAVVKCGAASIELVPNVASRRAGETQLYSLLAEDSEGKSWGGIRADSLSMSGGSCHLEQEACQGEKAGHQAVNASFGKLRATGSLTVGPGSLHELRVDPEAVTVGIGEQSPRYEVKGFDSYGNPIAVQIGPSPGAAGVRMVPDGSCEQTLAKCVADTSGPHEVIVEKDGVKGIAKVEVSPPTVLPTGELYIPYSQQLHARVPVVPGSWRLVPPYSSTHYYVSGEGVLAGLALAGGFNPITPGDLGHHMITAEAVALDGHPLRETYELDVVAPDCTTCAIHDGYRTFTFTWNNKCHICTQNLVEYQLLFEATLPGTPGQYTRYLMNPVLGWGCFGSSQERCAGIYQFGDYGWGVLPGVSVVKLYHQSTAPPYAAVPVGEWTVSVES